MRRAHIIALIRRRRVNRKEAFIQINYYNKLKKNIYK